jgi:hypothetical protein
LRAGAAAPRRTRLRTRLKVEDGRGCAAQDEVEGERGCAAQVEDEVEGGRARLRRAGRGWRLRLRTGECGCAAQNEVGGWRRAGMWKSKAWKFGLFFWLCVN